MLQFLDVFKNSPNKQVRCEFIWTLNFNLRRNMLGRVSADWFIQKGYIDAVKQMAKERDPEFQTPVIKFLLHISNLKFSIIKQFFDKDLYDLILFYLRRKLKFNKADLYQIVLNIISIDIKICQDFFSTELIDALIVNLESTQDPFKMYLLTRIFEQFLYLDDFDVYNLIIIRSQICDYLIMNIKEKNIELTLVSLNVLGICLEYCEKILNEGKNSLVLYIREHGYTDTLKECKEINHVEIQKILKEIETRFFL